MSNWDYLKSISLLGTDRKPLELSILEEPVHTYLSNVDSIPPPEALLHALSLDHFYQRAGRPLPQVDQINDAAPIQEYITYAPERFYKILDKISEVEKQKMKILLLTSWIQKVVHANRIVHPLYLVQYLNLLIQCPKSIRAMAIPSLGEKGKWLVAQNEKYSKLRPQEEKDLWSFGNAKERHEYLTSILKNDPDKAVELLESNWSTETAKEKLSHLTTILFSVHSAVLPFVEHLYYSEFKYEGKESVTQRKSREVLTKILLLLPKSKLHNQTMTRLSSYGNQTNSGLLKKVFQGNDGLITLPEENDDFFNSALMLKDYGIDPNSTEASDYKTDQLFWFSRLVSAIPYQAWSDLFGKKSEKVLHHFLTSRQFLDSKGSKAKSCLLSSLVELSDYDQNDDFLLCLLAGEKDKEIVKLLLPKLSSREWEKFIIKNTDLIDNDILSKRPHSDTELWSDEFTKKLIRFLLEKSRQMTHFADYQIGLTIAQFTGPKCLDYITGLYTATKDNFPNYNNWKKHIMSPIIAALYIKQELEEL